jgi:hypothetical protein
MLVAPTREGTVLQITHLLEMHWTFHLARATINITLSFRFRFLHSSGIGHDSNLQATRLRASHALFAHPPFRPFHNLHTFSTCLAAQNDHDKAQRQMPSLLLCACAPLREHYF